MGISLYGLTPATTYDALIKTGDNAPIDATLKPLSDGVGTNLPMEVSTTGINFTGSLLQGGVAVPTAAQVSAKQDTLVSGTNIKTINGTSVLGSGNIVTPTTSPSGVSGAIQFSNGSAFASDATNFFWDDTNKRLGVGTNAPTATVHAKSAGDTNATIILRAQNGSAADRLRVYSDGWFLLQQANNRSIEINPGGYINYQGYSIGITIDSKLSIGSSAPTTGLLNVKGSGSTSATTSLLVQNSAGTDLLRVRDDGQTIARTFTQNAGDFSTIISGTNFSIYTAGGTIQYNGNSQFMNNLSVNGQLSMSSTTQGFLPPRMTTTQKNAISAIAGLVVYDSTTNKLQCYNGSTWNDLF